MLLLGHRSFDFGHRWGASLLDVMVYSMVILVSSWSHENTICPSLYRTKKKFAKVLMKMRTKIQHLQKRTPRKLHNFRKTICDLVLKKEHGVGSKVFQPKYFEAEQS